MVIVAGLSGGSLEEAVSNLQVKSSKQLLTKSIVPSLLMEK